MRKARQRQIRVFGEEIYPSRRVLSFRGHSEGIYFAHFPLIGLQPLSLCEITVGQSNSWSQIGFRGCDYFRRLLQRSLFRSTRPGHGAFDTKSSDVRTRGIRKIPASHLTIATVFGLYARVLQTTFNGVADAIRVPRDDITWGPRPSHRHPCPPRLY